MTYKYFYANFVFILYYIFMQKTQSIIHSSSLPYFPINISVLRLCLMYKKWKYTSISFAEHASGYLDSEILKEKTSNEDLKRERVSTGSRCVFSIKYLVLVRHLLHPVNLQWEMRSSDCVMIEFCSFCRANLTCLCTICMYLLDIYAYEV